MTELSTQQAEGIEKVKAWYGDQSNERDNPTPYPYDFLRPFRWFGYAGTGKTFTAARIPEALGLTNVVFGTYTGKAASVLRRSLNRYGVNYPVSTIHSAIYLPTTSAEAAQALREARAELAELEEIRDQAMTLADPQRTAYVIEQGWAGPIELAGALSEVSESIPTLEANARRLRFELNPASEWAFADLIILDEVSMVNAKLAADIESFGVPILVLGDPAQLPPVEGGGYYTDAEPDHLLTEVLRAALDSPVTELATRVRLSQGRDYLGLKHPELSTPSLTEAMEHDIVLCWTNKRRWAMIEAIRKRLGCTHPVPTPVPGDTIMCLTNNKDMAVFNGQIFTVTGVQDQGSAGYALDVTNEDGVQRELQAYREGFQGQEEQTKAKNTGLGMRGQRMLATFAQAITVHKAQGSEWDRVYVVNETASMIGSVSRRDGRDQALTQARSWLYTAVTRAKESVTVTVAK